MARKCAGGVVVQIPCARACVGYMYINIYIANTLLDTTVWHDPTVKVKNRINSTPKSLRNEGHLDEKLYNFLLP